MENSKQILPLSLVPEPEIQDENSVPPTVEQSQNLVSPDTNHVSSPPPPLAVNNPSSTKQQQTETNHEGRPILQSPIPIYPRPLGIAYQNFAEFYKQYCYIDGERMEAGYCLVAALLQHYFPKPKFDIQRLPFQSESLIRTVQVEGTIYLTVTALEDIGERDGNALNDIAKKDDTSATMMEIDEGLGMEEPVPTLEIDGAQQQNQISIPTPTQSLTHLSQIPPQRSSVILLIAITTSPNFLNRSERKKPSTLHFDPSSATPNGTIVLGSQPFQKGHVVILSGRTSPTRPSWEFYTFDSTSTSNSTSKSTFSKVTDSESRLSISPWFGKLASHSQSEAESSSPGMGTNIFSFEVGEVEKVDKMFKGIVSCAYGDRAISTFGTVVVAGERSEARSRQRPRGRPMGAKNKNRKDGNAKEGLNGRSASTLGTSVLADADSNVGLDVGEDGGNMDDRPFGTTTSVLGDADPNAVPNVGVDGDGHGDGPDGANMNVDEGDMDIDGRPFVTDKARRDFEGDMAMLSGAREERSYERYGGHFLATADGWFAFQRDEDVDGPDGG